MTTVDTWLGDGAVLATVHVPDAAATSTGVVIVPGMGQEHVISYRTLRLLAQDLEARGVGSIRYNHVGHGDSIVEGPAPTLLEGARLAAEALRAAGFTRIVYLGLASAAPIAAAMAAEDVDAKGLVLWDPPESSKRWLRRARSLYATSIVDAATPKAGSGHVTIVGLEMTPPEVDDFTSLTYDASVADRMPVLLALREGLSGTVPTAFADRVSEGSSVDILRVTEHESLLDVSSVVARIPGRSVATVTDWVARHAASETATKDVTAPEPARTAVFPYTARGSVDPVLLEERLVRVGPDRLFAIETRPEGAPDDIPGLVLQAGSAEHRVGATRHQVTLGRELAGRGFRVLRLDRRGTGETGPVSADEPNLLYAREWLEDNENAVRSLELPPEQVGVAGLCSGGWLALMTDPQQARFILGIGVGTYQMTTQPPNEVADAAPRVDGETGPQRKPLVAMVKDHMPYWGMQLLARANKINIAQPLLHRQLKADSDVVLLMTPGDQEVFADRMGHEAVKRLASDPGDLTLVNFDYGDHALFESRIRDEVIDQAVAQTVRALGGRAHRASAGSASTGSATAAATATV